MLRNGEQLLLAIVIPVIVLVGGVAAADRLGLDLDGHRAVDVLTPGVLALAVMSTAFTSMAIATGFERRYGVIKRLGSSPLPRHGLLLGKVAGTAQRGGAPARGARRRRPGAGLGADAGQPAAHLVALVLAVGAGHRGLRRRSGCSSPASCAPRRPWPLANLVYLLLMAGGGVVLPTSVVRRRRRRSIAVAALRRARRGDARRARGRQHRRPLACSCSPPGRWSARCSPPRTFRWE